MRSFAEKDPLLIKEMALRGFTKHNNQKMTQLGLNGKNDDKETS